MNKVLQNSCAKGCLVYLAGLALVVILTTIGLSGLKGKFSVNTVGELQKAGDASAASTATPVAPVLTIVDQPANGDSAPSGSTQPAPPQAQQSVPAPAPAAQTQGGVISGDASAPFYVVQPGDTLWAIALHFGIPVDALRSINALAGDIIQPGQLLYLPQGDSSQPAQPVGGAPPPATPEPPPPSGSDPGSSSPSMPHTGINGNP